ncbi:bifunctional 2-polyprenyl-6-hydroxyphenol methylase/3-demethylubiquinol 3-O-methyltransferase UbiG [Acidomonas methanolica]|uniref:bifunctional 2-polyprenyl-6-hydroxyphenol methylase/3-demethylubiquinol 3-O-methyltransferase UbiG n=3 Tax=Acidomonas methanolica TaxID=437 RepID=UPI00104A061E|nr:bifunctional 2-polyprenyl-6-hydroxyphenol methylase/3-demethylubiquinol 3-O-methyltransferase UbiG [Acidomonas methanolica]MBU2653215.1 bifunctional 2-polyprenyl-6-hydroxyphenol methylase/3-demethylubiquinol 3-O-methyltransferase UbiG [Acidomonas methanolica]TCS32164.1 3-demethylubiquinone-9 3-methyltransferase [Acidomonas methanolica]GEK97598.1 ubiquinone biosynthesis O-methyltransferase [Acidomonas methanolica NBRC 104435]
MSTSSVSPGEIARFSALAERWWDPVGPMRPLHEMNPLRTGWVDARLRALHAARAGGGAGRLSLLDIGCGAGLASEAFARLGHDVLGLDASEEAIAAARAHLAGHDLPPSAGALTYRAGSAEDLAAEHARFDVVTALEVIEHVTDPAAFLRLLAELTKPGGTVAVSTINRTIRSLAVAKIGAEYVARLLPRGTHDWARFLRPDELARMARSAGLRMTDIAGMSWAPLPWPPSWKATRDTSINYIAVFTRD